MVLLETAFCPLWKAKQVPKKTRKRRPKQARSAQAKKNRTIGRGAGVGYEEEMLITPQTSLNTNCNDAVGAEEEIFMRGWASNGVLYEQNTPTYRH